ncbi:EamA family transporter [Candidatus Hodarchaeum mangrovi]
MLPENLTVLLIMLIYGVVSGGSAIILKIGIFKAGGIQIDNFFWDVLPAAWKLIKNRIWFIGGMAAILGFLIYTVALNLYDVSLVKPLVNTNLLFTFIFAYIFFQEKLVKKEWFGIAILILGLFIIAFSPNSESSGLSMNIPLLAIFFPIIVIMLIVMIFLMFVVKYGYAEFTFPLFAGSFFGMGTFFTKSLLISLNNLNLGNNYVLLFLYSLFMLLLTYTFAIIAQQLAFERGRLSIVSPITNSLSVTFSFIGAYFVFFEELIVPIGGVLVLSSFFKVIGLIAIIIALFILRREIDPTNFLDQKVLLEKH